jgi:hypothetical protein
MDGLDGVLAAVCTIPRRVRWKIENKERLIEERAARTAKCGNPTTYVVSDKTLFRN